MKKIFFHSIVFLKVIRPINYDKNYKNQLINFKEEFDLKQTFKLNKQLSLE